MTGLLVIEAGMPDFDERLKLLKKAVGMTEKPMRERLARVLWKPWRDADFPDGPPADNDDWINASEQVKQDYRGLVDAILREMLEPSEGMQRAGIAALCERDNVAPAIPFQAMIQHILNENQD